MLAPRSANARHSSIPGNSQGMRNLPGTPSFLGNLFRMTTEQCSFIGATPLRVVIPFRSSLGLVTVLPGSVPDPEEEAILELVNLDIISEGIWEVGFDLQPSEDENRCFLGYNWLLRLVTHTRGCYLDKRAGVGDVVGAEDWFFLSRSNALTMSLSSATSDEMAGVEELEFTLATTALARDCQTFDLLSMIFKQSEGNLSKKLSPTAEFNES
nr:hypothetical protein [Tanacetum cinerariifolium]